MGNKIRVIVLDTENVSYKVANVPNNLVKLMDLIKADEICKIHFMNTNVVHLYHKDDVEFINIDGENHFIYNKKHPFLYCNTDGKRNLVSVTEEHIVQIDQLVKVARSYKG
jgi:hypothetical protein